MDSKEFGLVAAQQLFSVEDLHYGYWDDGVEVTPFNFLAAQEAHTQFLFSYIEKYLANKQTSHMLDVGCGVGVTTNKLLKQGYSVDGLVPYAWMVDYFERLNQDYLMQNKTVIYPFKLEDMPTSGLKSRYELVFFSESFQYVNMHSGFEVISKIIKPGGTIIIFDFFRKDGVPGRSPMGGGHSLSSFYKTVAEFGLTIEEDIDVTDRLSPNINLSNELVQNRIFPFLKTLDAYLSVRSKFLYRGVLWFFRKRIAKLSFKYEGRDADSFAKYKSYRMIVLKANK